jgi:hypothetical protein
VDWRESDETCVEEVKEVDRTIAEIWRCDRSSPPSRLSEARRSLVVLMMPLRDQATEELAITLLDSGSADVVLIDPNWTENWGRLIGGWERLGPGRQLVVIAGESLTPEQEVKLLPISQRGIVFRAEDLATLSGALGSFEDVVKIRDAWRDLALLSEGNNTDGVLLRGLGRVGKGRKSRRMA